MFGAPPIRPGLAKRRLILPGARVRRDATATNRGLIFRGLFDAKTISGTTVYDASGNGYNGTLVNAPTVAPGLISSTALNFASASTQYINAANIPNQTSFTLSVWVYPTALGPSLNYETIFTCGSNLDGTYGHYFSVGNGFATYYDIDNNSSRVGFIPVPANQWSLITFTFESGVAKTIYVNGKLDVSVPVGAITWAGNKYIGTRTDNFQPTNSSFNGRMSDFRIYNYALSPQEVKKLYRKPTLDFYQPIDAIWSSLSADVRTASLTQTIDPVTSSSTGAVRVAGALSQTLSNLTLASTGTVAALLPASVKTIGATGCDFTTIEAWAASLSGHTFGGDQEGVLKGEVFTPSNSFSFSGFTTGPTARLIIRCSTGSETLGDTRYDLASDSGARITKTGGGGIGIISITDDNIKHWVVKGIGLYSNGANNPGVFCNNAGFDDGLVEDCLVRNVGANAYDMSAATGVGVARVLNSAAREISGNNLGVLGVSGHTDRVSVDFCTFVRHSTNTANTGYGVRYAVARNTYAGFFGSGAFADLGTGSTNYASSDSTGSSSVLQSVLPSQVFLSDGTSWDLLIDQLPNKLAGQGTDLTGVTEDAVGDIRHSPDPDIGWNELADRSAFTIEGALTKTIANLTLSSTGTVVTSTVTGTLTATIAALTLASTGTVLVSATASDTIDAVTSASTGTVRIGVSADATLPNLTLSSTGLLQEHGALASTIDPVTTGATGGVLVKGALSGAVGAITFSSQGIVPSLGTLDATLDDITASSAGNVYTSLVLSETLANITISSTGSAPSSGVVSQTIAPITLVSTSTHPVIGTVSTTIDDLTVAAPGTVLVKAALSKTLANLTSSSAGNAYTPVVLIKTIAAITLSSAGTVSNHGSVSKTIADLTTSATGKVLVRGALAKTIGPFKLHTRVIHPHSGSSDRFYLQIPRFNIDHPPSSDDLAGHLLEKLRQQQQWLDALSEAALQSANTPPLNPRFGTLRYAVGDWALTLGAVGLYIYKESGWVLIS